jgi:hypothetical protein
LSAEADTFCRNSGNLPASSLIEGNRLRGTRVADKPDPNRPKGSVTEAALFVSRWTAAKAGAAASLWTTMPRRVDRYLREMVSAHSQSTEREDAES